MSDSQFETYKLEKEVARMAAMETVTGRVVRINGGGFLVDTRDGWLNVSKYAHPLDVPMPRVGDNVRLKLDKAGFIRQITTVKQPEPQPEQPEQPQEQPEPEQATPPNRETTITRLACLNTSVAILSSGNRAVDADAVIALAARLETWAIR